MKRLLVAMIMVAFGAVACMAEDQNYIPTEWCNNIKQKLKKIVATDYLGHKIDIGNNKIFVIVTGNCSLCDENASRFLRAANYAKDKGYKVIFAYDSGDDNAKLNNFANMLKGFQVADADNDLVNAVGIRSYPAAKGISDAGCSKTFTINGYESSSQSNFDFVYRYLDGVEPNRVSP